MKLQHIMIAGLVVIVALAMSPTRATAEGYAAWSWRTNLPPEIRVAVAPTNRTAAAVDKLFKERPDNRKPPQMAFVFASLGRPDAFSQQCMYSRRQGTKQPSRGGGTVRFLLSDGGEVHVWSFDFTSVGLAIRYDAKGKGELLYK